MRFQGNPARGEQIDTLQKIREYELNLLKRL